MGKVQDLTDSLASALLSCLSSCASCHSLVFAGCPPGLLSNPSLLRASRSEAFAVVISEDAKASFPLSFLPLHFPLQLTLFSHFSRLPFASAAFPLRQVYPPYLSRACSPPVLLSPSSLFLLLVLFLSALSIRLGDASDPHSFSSPTLCTFFYSFSARKRSRRRGREWRCHCLGP